LPKVDIVWEECENWWMDNQEDVLALFAKLTAEKREEALLYLEELGM